MFAQSQKQLRQVFLTGDVYAVCLQHALSTEKEEVMGLLIGDVCINTQKRQFLYIFKFFM